MTTRAWIFVVATLLLGLATAVASLMLPFQEAPPATFLTLLAMATAAQCLKTEAPSHQLYYTTKIFLFASLLLLSPGQFTVIIVVAHGAEWIKERLQRSPHLRAWYVQPFNISVHILCGAAAVTIGALVAGEPLLPTLFTAPMIAGVVVASLVYLAANHLLVGLALMLARGVSLRDSGALAFDSLLTDAVLLLLGYVVAILWQMNPWLVLPALSPLFLILRALMIPQLQREARVDGKTGLLNARRFGELAERTLRAAESSGEPLAVIMADLDLLRNINNSYGHLAGDRVLASVGRTILETIRGTDLAGRFGGEEFAIVLPNMEPFDALLFAERLRAAVAARPIPVSTAERPVAVTMSLGVATYPQDGKTMERLIHAADLAVYQAKVQGRNRVVGRSEVPESFSLADAALTVPQRGAPAPGPGPHPGRSRASFTAPPQPLVVAAPAPEGSRESALPRPARLLVSGVGLGAVGLLVLSAQSPGVLGLTQVVALALLALVAELLHVRMYDEGSISVSAAIPMAVALTGDLRAVAVMAAAIALGHFIRQRPPVYKAFFNGALHLTAAAAALAVVRPLGLSLGFADLPALILPALGAATVYFLVESLLVAAVKGLVSGMDVRRLWRSEFSWLASHYIVLGLLSLFLIVTFLVYGPVALLVFLAPFVLMRQTQQQYVSSTVRSMHELKRLNLELNRANSEIMDASRSIHELNDELFHTLAKIIDARDPFVSGHAAQVAAYSKRIAEQMGLPPDRVELVRQAGLLHDIGKIGIPEAILQKPAALTPAEYERVKHHPGLGADLLQSSRSLKALAPFVRHHHERWDGRGYPAGLAGEEIPLEARIVCLCDAVETMASDRPYKQAMNLPEIVAEVQRCAGTQFDATVVDCFISIVEADGADLLINSAHEVATRSQRTPNWHVSGAG